MRERPRAAACSGLSDRGSTVVSGTGTLRGCAAVPPLTGRMRRSFPLGVPGLGWALSCRICGIAAGGCFVGEGEWEECLVPAGGGVGEFGGPLRFCYPFPAGWCV